MSFRTPVTAAVGLYCVVGISSALAAGAGHSFIIRSSLVRSSLDGKRVLPHRIHWIARTKIASRKVAAVDFLIDGKKLWVEHHPPYYYGDQGNYLVTSFLKPGIHRFTVKVDTWVGRHATDTVKARVLAAPAPPADLAGAWKAFFSQPSPDSPPAGDWRLVIDRLGWRIYDTAMTGDTLDVAYLSPSLVAVRTGMATGHPKFDLNGWCNNAPGSPARYHWTIDSAGLQFSRVSGSRQCGFSTFLTQPKPWTRAS
jgi:hypothetical protein